MAASFKNGAVVGLCLMAMVVLGSIGAEAQLSDQLTEDYYDDKCPQLFDIVRAGVKAAVDQNKRNAASLIRVHFHDCFVDGCDGSILLDNTTDGVISEQYAIANNNSIRQLDTIDNIKAQLEEACPGVVSCADLVALASRDAAIQVGLTYKYRVLFGRLDSFSASIEDANKFLPSPFSSYEDLVENFANVFLNEVDLIALSGAHTVGRVHCPLALKFIELNTSVPFNPAFQAKTNATCTAPKDNSQTLVNLDPATPDAFDNSYYKNLLAGNVVLTSDEVLWSTPGVVNKALVALYAANSWAFAQQFAASTIKMGNISPKLGDEGEIRLNCSIANSANPLWWSTRAPRIASQ